MLSLSVYYMLHAVALDAAVLAKLPTDYFLFIYNYNQCTYTGVHIGQCSGDPKLWRHKKKYQFLHDQHLPRWPMLPFHNNSVFWLKSILTSCQINRTELFKGRLLMTSSCCSAAWGCALPDQLAGPPSAGSRPAPRRSGHLTSAVSCIEHTALWEKWLITITSCAGSHRLILLHTHSSSLPRSLHPSLPSCPLPLLFLFNFTRDQCGCQAIYLFRALPQMRGPQKATAALPQIWSASVNFPSRVTSWQWHVALDGCVEQLVQQCQILFPWPQRPLCLWLLDVMQCGMWIIKALT